MEKQDKKSTPNKMERKKLLINSGKEAFLILSKIRKDKGIKVADVCPEIGISKAQYYRYGADYASQAAVNPKLDVLKRYADYLGYDIALVEKKSKTNKS